MDVKNAYDLWSAEYDTNKNKTRDLEAIALRNTLEHVHVARCLEIGCGTGKNTEWLVTRCQELTAVDLSAEMLSKAKAKITSDAVRFVEADISSSWTFQQGYYDLAIFSLVLEHVFNLDHIFRQVADCLEPGGLVYIGELHPFKQYSGTKARFETAEGEQSPECFNHHISDFIISAKAHGLTLTDLGEYFDDEERLTIPRILTLLFRKQG